MNFFSFSFLSFAVLLVLAFSAASGVRMRRRLLGLANLLFLVPLVPRPASWVAMGTFLLVTYGMLVVERRWPRYRWTWLFVPLVVAALAILRRYELLNALLGNRPLSHPFEIVGISYMSFKLIHMLVDLRQQQLAPVTFASYVNYQVGFYCVVAGPIQRYNDFWEFWRQIDRAAGRDTAGLQALDRLFTGLIKMGLLAVIALHVFESAVMGAAPPDTPGAAVLRLAQIFYAYPLYVYLNFSGYCDVVIGTAALLGLSLPENFNRPYVARNLIDFWNRWHISLTLWIRDYVFMTSFRRVSAWWPGLGKKAAYILLFVALCLAGLWHGATRNFLLFGIVHGLGVAVVQWYGDRIRSRLGPAGFKAYLSNPLIRTAAVAVTLHYVCFSFLFFRPDLGRTFRSLADALNRLV